MKLLMVTCLKESCNAVAQLFGKASIQVFSMTDVIGKKDGHQASLVDNWFSSGEEEYDSAIIFSFTNEGNAEKAMSLIDEYNDSVSNNFPIRAFVLPVERSNF
ncbi:hypothetical protein A4D02_17365 [Niastella koreensis]|uniref:Nitrogen regulatory protein P-II n=2 Tax=Niastella koreensis TaxID=354356 RepID=G8TD10_NIAKG|nr:hypothetical protein [Niastella koreensis]AEV97219.1 hypothetical protein Niako_0840 [Niastella koreensis GR20-10]OQP39105.1 hypothetical protein A4D02_17365 [Niastella koreensis]